MANPELSPKSGEASDNEINAWLEEIRKFYEKDNKIEKFRKEEGCLRLYLARLKEEAQPSGRLSICKLEAPHRKGGTAILFKGSHTRIEKQGLALKFNRPREEEDTRTLVENEYNVLPLLEHSNIIRAIDVGKFDIKTNKQPCPALCFILEPFIPQALDLREYALSLSYFGKPITEDLLDDSLLKLTRALSQWAQALKYVHTQEFVYLDVKPDNAILDKDGHLVVIDFGTAQKVDRADSTPTRIFFSEPYAHPRIKERFDRTSTDRVTNAVKRKDITFELDYYALGKSILELLETIAIGHPHDFPQRPLFQSLHFLATRLLDGQNKKLYPRSVFWAGEATKLDEVFDGLISDDYATIKYEDLKDVVKDLNKELGSWDPEKFIPELQAFPPKTLRVVPNLNTAFTDRLETLIEHPLLGRLKMVSQLGLVSFVYPTADHSRYDHVLGSYTYTRYYIMALFNDSQNCMFRNLINEDDIKASLLASLLHDLGQYPLAHDLQDVHPKIFDHSSISIDLLEDDTKDKKGRTLRDIVQDKDYGWGVDLDRVRRILRAHSSQVRLLQVQTVHDFKADMLSALIDGPVDADKADYIIRDSANCRIPYGQQLDIERLLSVLTTVRIPDFSAPHRVTIGIYEKGVASASAFSLARYLLYASVYWHHASRILKTMLQYASVMILPSEVFAPYGSEGRIKEIREKLLQFIVSCMVPPEDQLPQEAPPRASLEKTKQLIAEEPSEDALTGLKRSESGKCTDWYPGMCRTDWLMLNWLKQLSTSEQGGLGVSLINHILQRDLYKRVYTLHYDHTSQVETGKLIAKLEKLNWLQKVKLSENLQSIVRDLLRKKKPTVETQLHPPEDEVQKIMGNELAILVDVPDYKKFLPDRPLIYVPELESKTYYRETPAESYDLGQSVDYLMKSISPIRVLCHPDIRQWIGACVLPQEMELAISSALDRLG